MNILRPLVTIVDLTGYVGSDLHILLSEAEGIAQRRFLSKASHLFISHQGREAEGKELLDFAATNDEGIKNLRSNSETICLEDFEKALNEVKPSALKEGFSTVPNISFDDIGALDDIRYSNVMPSSSSVHTTYWSARICSSLDMS